MAEDLDIDLSQAEPLIPADLAMAAALDEARANPDLPPKVAAFFEAQTRLADDQRHHMAKQFVVELAIKKLDRWAKRLKLVLQLMTAVVGALALGVIGYFCWSAHEDRGLVVDSFSAPPGLEAKGLTSQAIAEDFVSRLSAIRDFANQNSITYTQDVRGSDSDTIKVELPETGISLVEVDRWLRDWLGRQTHIKGSIRDDGGGKLSLVVASPHLAPYVVKGDAADIDGLIQAGAEKAFQLYDPANYAVYLGTSGRLEEAGQAAEYVLARSRTDKERAAAYTILAFHDGDVRRGYVRAMEAVRLDPTQILSWTMASRIACNLARDELCLAHLRRAMQTNKSNDLPGQAGAHDILLASARRQAAGMLGDFSSPGLILVPATPSGEVLAEQAVLAAQMHDGGGAQADLDQAIVIGGASNNTVADARLVRLERLGDWPAAAAAAQSTVETVQGAAAGMPPSARGQVTTWIDVVLLPRLARAQALSGQANAAAVTIGQSPTDCYLCLRVRAQVAQAQGQTLAADRWFAEAVRQGPSLPDGYLDWGMAKLGRGDTSGAIALFQTASQKGPRYADPLERWGEALLARGDTSGAAAKFAEADKYAPRWGRNHLRWGEALMLSRHHREARAQYEIANALDLSKPDRAALNVLLDRTASGPLHG
jgi:tetratricopeptide (TPR) repeat protein